MNTLAIDTSTPRGSVAFAGNEVVFERPVGRAALSPPKIETATSSARWRHRALPDLFSALHELNPTDFDEILVGVGPGSFTGIRAGLAAAKGLALPRRLPIKAANSFDAIALTALPQLPRDCPQMCVLGDARREEVYFALYDRAGRPVSECRLGALEAIEVHNPIWFVSTEMEKYRGSLRETFGGFASLCETPVFPRAAMLQPSPLPLEPIYLRETDYKRL
jgi:tRNA threonylcarbamoyl adenosine modification protein YeaZ